MELLWLFLILFSVVISLAEKIAAKMGEITGEAKRQTEEEPVYPDDDVPVFAGSKQGEGRKQEEEFFRPPEREKAGVRGEYGPPGPVWPGEDGDWDEAFMLSGEFAENDEEDMDEERAERAAPAGGSWLGQELHDPGNLLKIMALAHVLARPDFKNIPWKRRL